MLQIIFVITFIWISSISFEEECEYEKKYEMIRSEETEELSKNSIDFLRRKQSIEN